MRFSVSTRVPPPSIDHKAQEEKYYRDNKKITQYVSEKNQDKAYWWRYNQMPLGIKRAMRKRIVFNRERIVFNFEPHQI